MLLFTAGSQLNHQDTGNHRVVKAADSHGLPLLSDSERSLSEANTLANCRYGTVASGEEQYEQLPRFGAGWFLHFKPPSIPQPTIDNNAEFVHVFKVFQEKREDGYYLPDYRPEVPLDDELATYIQAHPGTLWIIGNEVDRGPNPGQISGGQGDMYPAIYAQAYHDVRAFIKAHDPTARTAISALVEVTPGRLQYLDMVWQSYLERYGRPMPVDVWNMHIYILPELEPDGRTPNGIANIALGTDPLLGIRSSGGDPQLCASPYVYCYAEHDDLAEFSKQIIAMRQWMKEHGQQQKPLILSEYSILYPYIPEGDTCFLQDEYGGCFTPERIATFMTDSFALLNSLQDDNLGYALDDNRLVQQWLWFAMYTSQEGSSSNLLEPDLQTMTLVGETFAETVSNEAPVVNLVVDEVPKVIASVDRSRKTVVPIKVTFRNNGNTAVDEPFAVTFYADEEREIEIDSVTIAGPVRGCTTNIYEAKVDITHLGPGEHPFWVTVDSQNVIDEGPPGEEDNQGMGVIQIFPEASYIPMLLR